MKSLTAIFNPVHVAKAALFAIAAIGLALPSNSVAQERQTTRSGLADGVYVFGESSIPNQPGMTYTVLSVEDGRTIGAFYQPNSSFDCYSGEVTANRLRVNIINSYEQTVYPYEIALTSGGVLTAGNSTPTNTLEGFHRIDTISDIDQTVLAVCQADLAQ